MKTNILTMIEQAEVVWKPLGEVAELSNIGVDKKINDNEQKVRLLNFVDVFKNQYLTNETPTMVVTASDKKILSCNILKGDVFITPSSEIMDEIGQSAVAIENIENAVYSYHIMRLRIYDKSILMPDFLNYLFQTEFLRKQIRLNAQGITRFGLTQPKWKSLLIPIPPLELQKEIVKRLDILTELEATLEATLEAELTLRKKQYQYYRDFLLSENELAKVGFEWKRLGEVGELIRGNGLTKKDLLDDGVPAIHYGQIYTHFGTFADTTKSFTSPEVAKKLRKAQYGDVLIAGTSENVQDVMKPLGWFGNEIVFSGDMFAFRPNNTVMTKYLTYMLQTTAFAKFKEKHAQGTKVIRIKTDNFLNYQIPIPLLDTQAKIVAILDTFDRLTSSITDGLPKEIELRRKQYEYYRELLLGFPMI